MSTTRERILEESSRMFLSSGIKSIRMDDIASNLGVSKRTIYEIFGDKERLIKDSINYILYHDNIRTCAKTKGATNVVEELILMMDSSEDLAQRKFHMMMELKKFHPNIFSQISDESYNLGTKELIKSIKKGIDEGIFLKQLNVELMVSIFTASIYSLFNQHVSLVTHEIPTAEAFRYITVFFFRGISTDKGIKLIDEYLIKKYN